MLYPVQWIAALFPPKPNKEAIALRKILDALYEAEACGLPVSGLLANNIERTACEALGQPRPHP